MNFRFCLPFQIDIVHIHDFRKEQKVACYVDLDSGIRGIGSL